MSYIKRMIKKIVWGIFPHKYIIFESVPDVGDNSKAVFDEMIRRGLNKKYKLVWILRDKKKDYPRLHNVIYVEKGDKKSKWYITRAKCFICCNAFVYTDNSKQKSFFLTHGMYVKCPTAYYSLPQQISYCFSSSKQMEKIQAKALKVDMSKMVSLGFPRNDVFSEPDINLKKFWNEEIEKIIVWYPTFRQHSSGMKTGSNYSVPIIWKEEAAVQLNECAKKNKVLIVLKPHFAQDLSVIKQLKLSNINIINDTFFNENNISSYQFLNSCDALITDYSSVYFDYTLCNKPIGLIWEDYEEYKKNPGFALDMEYYMKGGVKIYTLDDFEKFIEDVACENDVLKDEREEIRDISNYSTDGKSSERVTDFIIEKAHL